MSVSSLKREENTQMASEQSGHARIHGETARRAIG